MASQPPRPCLGSEVGTRPPVRPMQRARLLKIPQRPSTTSNSATSRFAPILSCESTIRRDSVQFNWALHHLFLSIDTIGRRPRSRRPRTTLRVPRVPRSWGPGKSRTSIGGKKAGGLGVDAPKDTPEDAPGPSPLGTGETPDPQLSGRALQPGRIGHGDRPGARARRRASGADREKTLTDPQNSPKTCFLRGFIPCLTLLWGLSP